MATRILIAERDAVTARVLQLAFDRAGYEADFAPDGMLALEALRRGGYVALISGWIMPGLGGIELAERVRAEIVPAPIVVLLTVLATDAAKTLASAAGASGLLTKPVDPAGVVDLIRSLLAQRTSRDREVVET